MSLPGSGRALLGAAQGVDPYEDPTLPLYLRASAYRIHSRDKVCAAWARWLLHLASSCSCDAWWSLRCS